MAPAAAASHLVDVQVAGGADGYAVVVVRPRRQADERAAHAQRADPLGHEAVLVAAAHRAQGLAADDDAADLGDGPGVVGDAATAELGVAGAEGMRVVRPLRPSFQPNGPSSSSSSWALMVSATDEALIAAYSS